MAAELTRRRACLRGERLPHAATRRPVGGLLRRLRPMVLAREAHQLEALDKLLQRAKALQE